MYSEIEPAKIENCLLDCLSRLMARYGYAYAGQVAGLLEATDFVPMDALKEVCQFVVEEHSISQITPERMMEAIGILFDRRDPCLNNLAFRLCERYYAYRLIGLDLPLDFLSAQIYKNSDIYFDTNFLLKVALSGNTRYKEFKEIVKFAPRLGITFAVSELTIAESLRRVGDYRQLLEQGEETVPTELLEEAEEDILQSEAKSVATSNKPPTLDSRSANRLKDMGIKIVELRQTSLLDEGEKLNQIKSELHEFDKKYRKTRPIKDDNALYHDAQLCHIVRSIRKSSGKPTFAWFLTDDNSVIAHGIHHKGQDEAPYSIKLITLLTTLSPFVETQTLRLEFQELFANLVSKDILPKDYQFSANDLQMFVGFDLKAKEMPPEFIRKGIAHIKKEILKGGGLTEENKPTVLYEFNKFLASPEKNFIELQRRYESKIQARDKEIQDLKIQRDREKDWKNRLAILLPGIFGSIILWIQYPNLFAALVHIVDRPLFISTGIQLAIISVVGSLLLPRNARVIAIAGGIATVSSIIVGLA